MERDVVDYRDAGSRSPTAARWRSSTRRSTTATAPVGALRPPSCAGRSRQPRCGEPLHADRSSAGRSPRSCRTRVGPPTTLGEWFEVHNPGTEPVDMTGLHRSRTTTTTASSSTPPSSCPPAGYALFGAVGRRNGGGHASTSRTAAGCGCYNDSDELVIADRDGVQVDRVRWDDGRTFPDPDGASMSLHRPERRQLTRRELVRVDDVVGGRRQGHARATARGARRPGQQPIVITEIMFDPETPDERAQLGVVRDRQPRRAAASTSAAGRSSAATT